jgi:hypothetical protein
VKVNYLIGAALFVAGIFVGIFLTYLMQSITRRDEIEKHILEQRRKECEGQFCEPDDYFDHFNAHRDRRVCPERRSESGKVSNIDYRLLHHVNGHLGVQKDSGK